MGDLVTRPDRLLLIQPRWLGDVLLCTPAIREARHALPDARIDFVTEPPGAEALRGNRHLDEVLVAEPGVRSRFDLLRRVRAGRYDAVIDFRSTNSTAQITAASGAAVRVGIRGRGPRNLAYTRLVERQGLTTYAARHKLDMLGAVGVPVQYINDLALEIGIDPDARRWAEEQWREIGAGAVPVVALTGVSREAYKQWGADRWAGVADELSRLGARVLLTFGPGERGQAEAIAGAARHPVIAGFETPSIHHLAALLERCSLWVGNDGGVKHLAAAVGLPTIAVGRWQIGPVWTDATAAAAQQFIERAPPGGCDLRCVRCAHLGCLRAIGVEEVAGRAKAALAAGSPRVPRAGSS